MSATDKTRVFIGETRPPLKINPKNWSRAAFATLSPEDHYNHIEVEVLRELVTEGNAWHIVSVKYKHPYDRDKWFFDYQVMRPQYNEIVADTLRDILRRYVATSPYADVSPERTEEIREWRLRRLVASLMADRPPITLKNHKNENL